jgi:amino acid transporter
VKPLFISDTLNQRSNGIRNLLQLANGDESVLEMLLAISDDPADQRELLIAFNNKAHPMWSLESGADKVASGSKRKNFYIKWLYIWLYVFSAIISFSAIWKTSEGYATWGEAAFGQHGNLWTIVPFVILFLFYMSIGNSSTWEDHPGWKSDNEQ